MERLNAGGNNYQGNLGTGDLAALNTPSKAIKLRGKAVAISLGEYHNCVVLENGEVKCWGNNRGGQLGIGEFSRSSPVEKKPKLVSFD